ncbi:hypothetical protein [Streptosporangium sp. CA-115845]|uniref:hypothetical protein n=1 Tax=Streptosporangium sp. CA-115845 TaxID=3240071 RepID=UPI003D92FEA1
MTAPGQAASDPVQLLLASITAHADMWANAYHGQRQSWRHSSFAALLLECGQLFLPAPRPASITPGPPGSCFASAAELADRHDLVYVEGVVLTSGLPFAFDHAWCAGSSRRSDLVIDPTLPDGHALAYLGVPLTTAYRRTQHADRGDDAILTNGRLVISDNTVALRDGLPAATTLQLGRLLPDPSAAVAAGGLIAAQDSTP